MRITASPLRYRFRGRQGKSFWWGQYQKNLDQSILHHLPRTNRTLPAWPPGAGWNDAFGIYIHNSPVLTEKGFSDKTGLAISRLPRGPSPAPASSVLRAALTSRSWRVPHSEHRHCLTDSPDRPCGPDKAPQIEQILVEFLDSTSR